MKFTARPVADRIIVRYEEENKMTPGGIILPDNAKEKPTRGKVVALGSGSRLLETGYLKPFEVEEGDNVIFNKYAGTEVEIDGETFVVLREQDILLVLN